jgi:hypothetical protein
MTLTADMLIASMRKMRQQMEQELPPAAFPLRVFFTTTAVKDSDERLFPTSRHRSRRILKKLLRRHGGEFRKVPCIVRINGDIYAHPSFKAQFDRLPVSSEPRSLYGSPIF